MKLIKILAALTAMTASTPASAELDYLLPKTIECSGLGWFSTDTYIVDRDIHKNHADKYDTYFTIHRNGKLVGKDINSYPQGLIDTVAWDDEGYKYYLEIKQHQGYYRLFISEPKWSKSKGNYEKDISADHCRPIK